MMPLIILHGRLCFFFCNVETELDFLSRFEGNCVADLKLSVL